MKTYLLEQGTSPLISNEKFFEELNHLRNWEEVGNNGISLKQLEYVVTSTWEDGWYKNASSGRSHNHGISTDSPQRHRTLIVKGGDFFIDIKRRKSLFDNNFSVYEIFGGITQKMAENEYRTALLIQEKFKSELGKKANCPQPMDIKTIVSVICDNHTTVDLVDFFLKVMRDEHSEKLKFTAVNIMRTAIKLGIDVDYPTSTEASNKIRNNPWHWVISQCLEKTHQSVYQYIIDGPNTRILDLMTLPLHDRQKYFVEANDAIDLNDAVNKFTAKLVEFYGVLHKNLIGYQSGFTEHCTLMDITITGVVMDIGGMSEDKSNNYKNEAYLSQMIRITDLIIYVCKNVFNTSEDILNNALKSFWDKYKTIYSDENTKHFSEESSDFIIPKGIRTSYVDSTTGNLISLAPDLIDQFA